jgi:hypothetical protein
MNDIMKGITDHVDHRKSVTLWEECKTLAKEKNIKISVNTLCYIVDEKYCIWDKINMKCHEIDSACDLIKQELSLNYKNIAEISRISVSCLSSWRKKYTTRDDYTLYADQLTRFIQLYDIAQEILRRYKDYTPINPHMRVRYHSFKESIYECLISDPMDDEKIYNIIDINTDIDTSRCVDGDGSDND